MVGEGGGGGGERRARDKIRSRYQSADGDLKDQMGSCLGEYGFCQSIQESGSDGPARFELLRKLD